jgi:hypothetical protein
VRGLSTVAAFAVLITAFAAVMLSAFFFHELLRSEAQRGIAAVQSSVVRDVPVRFLYNGSSCGLEGGAYVYYLVLEGGRVVHNGTIPACPPEPGFYKYVGVMKSGDTGYAYVYVGPGVVDVISSRRTVLVERVGEEFSFQLYLKVFNNSSGWMPVRSLRVRLEYDESALSCGPVEFEVGPLTVSPAGLEAVPLGAVSCTVQSSFASTVINATADQEYEYGGRAWSWHTAIPAVVEVVNRTALLAPAPPPAPPAACAFSPSSGALFGSPDGTPATGFNELNGWAAAWGPDGGGVRISLMPGITPPDSTGTGTSYTVELKDVQIGTLTVSGGPAAVTVEGAMPGFMDEATIKVGDTVIYHNGPAAPANLAPGTYAVYATFRVRPSPDVFGLSGALRLACNGTPVASITLRVPRPEEWGLRADVYSGSPPPLPIGGPGYAYKGSWSVGGIYFWLSARTSDQVRPPFSTPYFSSARRDNTAPKWAAYWINPAGTAWNNYAIKFAGTLHVPWDRVRVGVWHDDAAYVKLCGIDTSTSWWVVTLTPRWSWTSGTCTPGNNPVEVGYYEGVGEAVLVLVIGPDMADSEGNIHGPAYIPTIDGAWYCDKFWWKHPQWGGTCDRAWSFVPASQDGVPYFVASGYTPGPSDGGGAPRP